MAAGKLNLFLHDSNPETESDDYHFARQEGNAPSRAKAHWLPGLHPQRKESLDAHIVAHAAVG